MRKFGIKYAALHPQHEQVREAFVAVRRRDDWLHVFERWYGEDRPGRCPGPDRHKTQGERP
jgi:hypothetical protein